MSNIVIQEACYDNPEHGNAILSLLDKYAQDPMGGGKSLSEFTKSNLIKCLRNHPTSISLLASMDGEYVGLLNAFSNLSTFKCKPLFNIHDLSVLDDFRGMGVASALLARLETIAIERDYCKLTLEVLEGNLAAKAAYKKFGFTSYELDPRMGAALFWEKPLTND